MDEKLRERRLVWIEALEGGNYEQATGRLRAGDRYCCLGVACDIYKDDPYADNSYWNEDEEFVYMNEGWSGELPQEVADYFGVDSELEIELIARNDASGEYDWHSFDEIAKVIRQEWNIPRKETPNE